MFPPRTRPFRAAALRGLDRALEFATLGEYGLPPTPQVAGATRRARRRRPLGPRPAVGAYTAPLAPEYLAPASAAARRLRARPAPIRLDPQAGLRGPALAPGRCLTSVHRIRGGAGDQPPHRIPRGPGEPPTPPTPGGTLEP